MERKTKKIISLLLCLLLLLQMAPMKAEAVASGTSGAAAWTLDAEGTLTVSGGEMENYTAAAEQPWAEYAQQIQKVIIGNNVTRVGDYAFAGCSNLAEVSIGSSVYTIGAYAFAGTTALTEAHMPENVTVFCEGVFRNSGLEKLYIYNRKTEHDGYWNIEDSLPLHTVIYCYPFSHAADYFGRETVMLTDDLIMQVDNGSSTLVMDANHPSYVRDLWGAADGLVLDYNVSMSNADIIRVHNELAQEDRLLGEEFFNNGKMEVEVQISLRNYRNIELAWIRAGADYSLFEHSLEQEVNNDYGQWSCWSNEAQFITVSGGADSVNISIHTDLQALEAYAGEPISDIFVYISVRGSTFYRGYGGYEYSNYPTTVESVGFSIYDTRLRESWVEYDWMHSLDERFAVEDWAPYGDQMPEQEYARFFEPVSRQYVWDYQISREGWFYNEETEEDIYPGNGFWELEGDGIFTEVYEGVLYGGVRGTYDAGSNGTVSIREMLSPEELDFVETLRGVEARGLGGEASISLAYTLTLTFADGSQVVLEGSAADEGSSLVGFCPHTCSNCGMCTAEEMLACNTSTRKEQGGERGNSCRCEDPKAEAICTVIPEDQVTVVNESYMADLKVRVEMVEPLGDSPYVQNITWKLLDTSIINLFEITVYMEDGTPYKLNEWGGEEEKLTLTIPVDKEWADLAFQSGDAVLYHLDKNGNYEQVPVTYDSETGTITFTATSFSPYALVQTVGFYGRKALMQLPNSEGLLYAYEQIALGVENAQEVIYVYDGVHPVSWEEVDIVMSAYLRDYVAHFWCEGYELSGTADSLLVVKPKYTMTGAELQEAMDKFEEVTQEILAGINPGMDDYQRELYVHDQITFRIQYQSGRNAHNAYGALVEGKAVCDGYSEAFGYLLQRLGIQTFQALGYGINPYNGGTEKHSWTYVRIKGKYYHVDTTWDSQKSDIFHMYFNQNDEVMFEDHVADPAAYALPVCNSRDTFYFEGKEEELNVYSVETVSKLLKENDNAVHVYIPQDVGGFIQWLNANITDICRELGMSGAFSAGRVAREFRLEFMAASAGIRGTVSGVLEQGEVSIYRGDSCMGTEAIGESGEFQFAALTPGVYTLRFAAEGCFTEERTVDLSMEDVLLEIALVLKGDVNGDGKLSNRDATRLLQYLAGWSVEVQERTLDINSDGKSSNRDATRLLQYLAGWNVSICEE